MAIRSGKLYISKEEIELIRAQDLQELYKRNEENFFEFCELVDRGNRVSYPLAQNFMKKLQEEILKFPEELRYKLINKFSSLFVEKTKFFDIDKLSDEFLSRILVVHLNKNQYKPFFERMKKNINNILPLIKEPEFRDEISRIVINDISNGTSYFHDKHGFSHINPSVMLEFKPQILENVSKLQPMKVKFLVRTLKSCPDEEIYQALRSVIFGGNENWDLIEEFLDLKKENQASINELIMGLSRISDECFKLITLDVVKENLDKIIPKLYSPASFGKIIKTWPETKLDIETFFVQNPSQIVSFCRDFYLKDNIRVQSPEFVKVAIEESGKHYSDEVLQHMKEHPDFRESALQKLREIKQKNKVRKRTSVLANNLNITSYALADRIYKKYFQNNIEEYVEKSWHMFTTIQEESIGKVIYDNMDLLEKVSEFCQNEDLYSLMKQAGPDSVKSNLYKELGNFARGSQFYHDHEKEIERSIRELRKTDKVLNS
jgi:hypothetical protein